MIKLERSMKVSEEILSRAQSLRNLISDAFANEELDRDIYVTLNDDLQHIQQVTRAYHAYQERQAMQRGGYRYDPRDRQLKGGIRYGFGH